ncbi:MAG: hypothetical protein DWI58_15835 [Chloroflexi bacterium]|nr:MAG: hypothetical protein DWI58_15835 [Chloroflexota bacterium]
MRNLWAIIAEELARWGAIKVLGGISGGGIMSFVVLYFALLGSASLPVRLGIAASFAGIVVVLILIALVAIGASTHPMLTVDSYDGANGMYFRVSVVGEPPLSVVRFQLSTRGQSVVPTAEITIRKTDGATFLEQGGASGATWAHQNIEY